MTTPDTDTLAGLLVEIRGAVARGWCAEANAKKELDPDLAEAIVAQIYAMQESTTIRALAPAAVQEPVAWTMADDLVERLRIKADMIHLGETIAWGSDVALMHEAVARITDLEAKLQRLGRELNLAKYGEPDFAWEIHKNAVADLETRLAAAEAKVNRLREGEARLSLLLNETALARDAAEAGENALAKAGSEARIALAGMVRPYNAVNLLDAALAAYEARRKG